MLVRAATAAILCLAVVAGPALAEDQSEPKRRALIAELGRNRVEFHAETGQLRFAAGSRARPSAARELLGRPVNARAAAQAFVARYGNLFGAKDTRAMLLERAIAGGQDRMFFRFRQVERGVPILGAELTVQADDHGNVQSAMGEVSPLGGVETTPVLSQAQARQVAREAAARRHGLRPADFAVPSTELWIYDPALLGANDPVGPRLVWRMDVIARGGEVNDFVLVDAISGGIALRFSQVLHALSRRVCDASNGSGSGGAYPCSAAAAVPEGSIASAHAEVQGIHATIGDFHAFFFNRFGRDSIDGSGRQLVATARYCGTGCANRNAFWDGEQAAFWPGMGTDDIVGHEFAHGFTQYASNLFYYAQSGAINEALSDIFGEFIDLTNGSSDDTPAVRWLMGEGSYWGPIRSLKDPTAAPYGDPDRMTSLHFSGNPDDNHGVHTNSGVANKAAYLMTDGETFNGHAISGLGIDKAAAIWYRAATGYLASGSDYADLGSALNQACSDLVGTNVKDSTGTVTGALNSTDCAEVAKVVLATEMGTPPATPGAARPPAPVCTSGTPADIFFDEIQPGHPGWQPGGKFPARWGYDTTYAASGPGSLRGMTPSSAGGSSMTRAAAVTLPPNTFLTFRHAHRFDNDGTNFYDGGIVEYQVNGGSWLDARTLITHNGYGSKPIFNGFGSSDNPLRNRLAFVGYSPGYFTTRIDFSSLAGQSVRFRFRTGTDAFVSDYGWFIDDVRLFSCSGGSDTTPPDVSPPNTDLRSGVNVATGSAPIRVRVSFTASDPAGISARQMQRSNNGAAYKNVAMPSATATAKDINMPVSASATRRFRARATDGLANQSAWATGPAFRVLAIQDGTAGITQTGTWTRGTNSSFFGGSVRYATAAGARQTYSATVSDFAVVTTRGPNRGRAEVWVDGTLRTTVDLYAPSVQHRQVVYAIDFGAPGAHTIELRATGTRNGSSKGTRVDLDAFLALAP
jgi:bacillolysin